MRPDLAKMILDAARERGIITPSSGASEPETPAQELERLLAAGAVSLGLVEELGRELAAGSGGDTTEASSAEVAQRPLLAGDRYEVGELLGRGGMGRVYRAYDRVLSRDVALKVLAGHDSGEGILHEARAQARVDHPHVCKVFDAGGGDGAPRYIAMQLIDGVPLTRLIPSLALEEKVRLAAAIAEGVHAAHKLRLVHRDLKPGNILVARGDAGLHPYVTDFGLAAETAVPVPSATGVIVGTPQYMSPEQARGQRILDERSDVYSLGATFYALFQGSPPFEGDAVAVLHAIVHDDAPPLSSAPRELRLIVGRCLEKDPARRYATARDLADDLRRYLAGEPIAAHAPSLLYRLRKGIARHRVLAAGVAVALAGVGVGGALWVRSRLASAERAALALRFGQKVSAVEESLSRAYLLPLHDVRPERAQVRAEMAAIAADLRRAGDEAAGAGEYALGRGALALDDLDGARQHLERARAAGNASPDVDYALGMTLGRLYQRGLDRAARSATREERDRAARALEQELRAPALAHLEAARGARIGEPTYVEALIALYEGRADDAVARAGEAFQAAPWMARARQLSADARLMRASALAGDAHPAEALAENGRAAGDLAAALAIAKSDPEILASECERRGRALTLTYVLKQPFDEAGEAAIAACTTGLTADPDNIDMLYGRARARVDLAFASSVYHGRYSAEDLQLAIDDTNRVLAAQPDHDAALLTRGRAFEMRGKIAEETGGDPEPAMRRSIADLERADALRPLGADAQLHLGATYHQLAYRAEMVGQDPLPLLVESARHLRAAASDPKPELAAQAWQELSYTHKTRAEHARRMGRAWRSGIDEAIRTIRRSIELEETAIRVIYLANTYSSRAQFEGEDNLDPSASIAEAEAAYRRGLSLDPKLGEIHRMYGMHLANIVAPQLAARGVDPRPTLRQAVAVLAHAAELRPNDLFATLIGGYANSMLADADLELGADPTADQRAAEVLQKQAEALAAGHPFVALGDCMLQTQMARAAVARRRDPSRALAAGDRDLAQLRASGAPAVETLTCMAGLSRWRAAVAGARGRAVLADGIGAAATAFVLRPTDRELARALAELCVDRYAGDPGDATRGPALAAVARAWGLAPLDPRVGRLEQMLLSVHGPRR